VFLLVFPFSIGAARGVAALDEQIHFVKSVEDPNVVPDVSVCALASFTPNAVLAASLYAVQTRSSDASIVNTSRRVGFGTACALITSLAVGQTAPIIAEFNIGDLRVIGEGECVIGSNTVPVPGLVLVGCTVPLEPDDGVPGGIATSNTVFNPFGVPGFDTGSLWTVRLYGD
jgi:hypothetical protein